VTPIDRYHAAARVQNPAAVVDGGVDVSISGPAVNLGGLLALVAPPAGSPASTVGDPGKSLDIYMDQFTRNVTLIAANRFRVRGTVTSIETPQTCLNEDVVHC
jgi:hypothetical protein